MKNISKIKKNVKEVLKTILKIFLVLLIVYNLVSILGFEDVLKKTGFEMIIVEKYQSQKNIKQNTLVISKLKNNKYHINDLVVIKISDSKYIHRIVNIDKEARYVTKGDDNYKVDAKPLKQYEIEGKVIAKIPLLGIMFRFAKTIAFSVLICIYIIFYFGYSIHLNNKKKKRRKKREIIDIQTEEYEPDETQT